MKHLSTILFAIGALVMISAGIVALNVPNEDWLIDHADGYKLMAITFFAAACAAQMIWGERRGA